MPEEVVQHAWSISGDRRFCNRCGAEQHAVPATFPVQWMPTVGTCPGGPIRSEAEIKAGQ